MMDDFGNDIFFHPFACESRFMSMSEYGGIDSSNLLSWFASDACYDFGA